MEKTLNTRLKLRYDSYENWLTNDPTLLAGELALAYVTVKQDGAVEHVPSVLIKCGDGTHKYSELDYVFAKAADVISAAKSESALTTFVNNVIAGAGIATDEAMTALATRVTTAEGEIDTLQGLVGDTKVATQISNAIAALDLANTYDAKGSAAAVQSALEAYETSNDAVIAGIKTGNVINDFASVETELGKKETAGAAAQALADAKAYADGKDTAIAAAKKAGDDAQADVDALEALVGTVADGKTVVQMISEAQAAATYDDTALAGRVSTAESDIDALEVLVGDTKVSEQINSALINNQADWNQNDSAAASYIQNRPFYEDIGREMVNYYSKNVTTQYDSTYYVADLSPSVNIETTYYTATPSSNITVVISHDGEENTYTNVPITTLYIGGGVYQFDYLGGQEGYPFKITSNKLYVTASGIYTVRIFNEKANIVVKIPAKFIPTDDVATGNTAKFATNRQIRDYVEMEINNLDKEDTAVDGQYVSAVSEIDGVITVERAALPNYTDVYAPKTHTHAIANVTALQDILNTKAAASDVTALSGKVTTLIGADADKSVRTIANEELAAQLIPETAQESLDTLQEIAAWIQSHPGDASAMSAAIDALEEKVGDSTVSAQITAAINELKAGDIKSATDRIAALEADTHTHANKALLDTYTQTEADLADAVAKKHEHANATELAKFVDGDKAKLDTAVQTITAGTGLTATKTGTDVAIGIDDTVTWIFDCGSSAV